jgi:hypothetical protein
MDQVPTLLLLMNNSLLLPLLIEFMVNKQRLHAKSLNETIQFKLNSFFLTLNTIVVPMLGLTSIASFVEYSCTEIHHHNDETMSTQIASVGARLVNAPLPFMLKYMLNCTFLTTANTLLQIPQLLHRWTANVVTKDDADAISEPWPFYWGYWYSWALTKLTMGIIMCTVFPSLLPCAALFFVITYAVDRHNFKTGVYLHCFVDDRFFVLHLIGYMRNIMAAWWFITGVGLRVSLEVHQWTNDSVFANRNGFIYKWGVISGYLLASFGIIVWLWNSWVTRYALWKANLGLGESGPSLIEPDRVSVLLRLLASGLSYVLGPPGETYRDEAEIVAGYTNNVPTSTKQRLLADDPLTLTWNAWSELKPC